MPKGGGKEEEDVIARVSKQFSWEKMSRDLPRPATAEERLLFPEVTSIETARDPGNIRPRSKEVGRCWKLVC